MRHLGAHFTSRAAGVSALRTVPMNDRKVSSVARRATFHFPGGNSRGCLAKIAHCVTLGGPPLAAGGYDVEDPSCRIAVHRHLLESKRLLREGYLHWYRELLPAHRETEHLSGDIVEVGCGPGFLEEFIPGLIKTDSVPNPFA